MKIWVRVNACFSCVAMHRSNCLACLLSLEAGFTHLYKPVGIAETIVCRPNGVKYFDYFDGCSSVPA